MAMTMGEFRIDDSKRPKRYQQETSLIGSSPKIFTVFYSISALSAGVPHGTPLSFKHDVIC
jgi:hypothetical protein